MNIKKNVLTFLILCISCSTAYTQSQSKGIQFEKEESWSKLVEKAKKEKKMIFIDCFTTWCGPCKRLDQEIFSQPEVGEYFNANFVNAKVDCEKPEGIVLKNRFDVAVYPTLLFYDPATDQIAHRCVGFMKSEKLIEHAKRALSKDNIVGLGQRYEEGTLTKEQLSTYLKLLESGGMGDKQNEVALSYLKNISAAELAEKENWDIMVQNVRGIESSPMKIVTLNPAYFYPKVGKQAVDAALQTALNESCSKYLRWMPGRSEFDHHGAKELINYLQTLNIDGVPVMLCKLYVVEALARGDFKQMMSDLRNYERYQFDGSTRHGDEIVRQLRKLATSKNQEVINEAIQWVDKWVAQTEVAVKKAARLDTKMILQRAINDEAGAQATALEIQKINEQEKTENSGVIRATQIQ